MRVEQMAAISYFHELVSVDCAQTNHTIGVQCLLLFVQINCRRFQLIESNPAAD
jgi:hypothetical protein